jgi:hypothetical protein
VSKLFKSLDWWKSTGFDDIRAAILAVMADSKEFEGRTGELFTSILRSRDVPRQWRVVIMAVLYKGKGPRQDPTNCRAISLLSILMKAYEKILVDRVIHFLEANGEFDQNTNGSRKHRSAVDNAMLILMAAEIVVMGGGKAHRCIPGREEVLPVGLQGGHNGHVGLIECPRGYLACNGRNAGGAEVQGSH